MYHDSGTHCNFKGLYIKNVGYKKVVIFTDSKSSLQHIARCASGRRGSSTAYTILQLEEFDKNNVVLKLQWIPSHIGLTGNEEVDRLANRAASEGIEILIKPCYFELLPIVKKKCHLMWTEYFNERSKDKGIWYRTMQSEPPRIPWFGSNSTNRRYAVIAHRLRSGHIPLNKFGYLMKKVASPNCETCGTVEDIQHLLLECVRNQAERDILLRTLKLKSINVGLFNSILAEPWSNEAKLVYTFVINSLR